MRRAQLDRISYLYSCLCRISLVLGRLQVLFKDLLWLNENEMLKSGEVEVFKNMIINNPQEIRAELCQIKKPYTQKCNNGGPHKEWYSYVNM